MEIRLNSDKISFRCKIFLWGLIIHYNRRGLLSASCMIIFYRFQTIKIRDFNPMKSYFRDDELEFWSNHLVEWQIVWAKNPKDRNKTDIKEKLLSISVVTYIAWISFLILQVLSQIQTLHNCEPGSKQHILWRKFELKVSKVWILASKYVKLDRCADIKKTQSFYKLRETIHRQVKKLYLS